MGPTKKRFWNVIISILIILKYITFLRVKIINAQLRKDIDGYLT
jgi:hypothetical protein